MSEQSSGQDRPDTTTADDVPEVIETTPEPDVTEPAAAEVTPEVAAAEHEVGADEHEVGAADYEVAADETAASETAASEPAAPAAVSPAPAADAEAADGAPAPSGPSAPAPAAPRPMPSRPRPGPPSVVVPRPTPRSSVPAAPAGTRPVPPEQAAFGRVGDDGTVFVITADGEREVGSFPGAPADEAIGFFARKYDDLLAHADLYEQRLSAADVGIGEIDSGLAALREATTDVKAVGDLDALAARVTELTALAKEKRTASERARTAAREELRARRTALVEEAEALATADPERTQWRADGQRMKDLFDIWREEQKAGSVKGAVRLDRTGEDELWKRFSHARTAFDRKRRQHFANLDDQHSEAKTAKAALVKEAEALVGSTDWGPTAATYKRLMDRWRTAGRAAKKDDDELWGRFKGAQDAFFSARSGVLAEQDAELATNLEVKLALLVEAEALLPVTDLDAAKTSLRSIQDRWESAGKVPRSELERVEKRMRAVEQAVRGHEDDRWHSSNPEARARAQSAVDQLEAGIADLEADLKKATDQGKAKRAADAQAAIDARREWLEQARKALKDFGG